MNDFGVLGKICSVQVLSGVPHGVVELPDLHYRYCNVDRPPFTKSDAPLSKIKTRIILETHRSVYRNLTIDKAFADGELYV